MGLRVENAVRWRMRCPSCSEVSEAKEKLTTDAVCLVDYGFVCYDDSTVPLVRLGPFNLEALTVLVSKGFLVASFHDGLSLASSRSC